MTAGMRILESRVKNVRQLIAFDAKLSELRQAETRAEEQGNIEEALAIFSERMSVIVAGPGASQALAAA